MRSLILTILVASAALGCRSRVVSPSDLRPTSGRARIELVDGTWYFLAPARLDDGYVCGDAEACHGPSCDELTTSPCVAEVRVTSVAIREADPEKIAAGTGLGFLAAALTVAVYAGINAIKHWRFEFLEPEHPQ